MVARTLPNNDFMSAGKNAFCGVATMTVAAGATILAGQVYRIIYQKYLAYYLRSPLCYPDSRLKKGNWFEKKLIENRALFSGLDVWGPPVMGIVASIFFAKCVPITPMSADYWQQAPKIRNSFLSGRPGLYMVGVFAALYSIRYTPDIYSTP